MGKRISKNTALFRIVFDREKDGRWIAEIPSLPGVMVYGTTKQDAVRKVRAVAFRTLADIAEQGKMQRKISSLFTHAMADR